MRPNVLLVVLDTARADAFEPYGALPGSSPAIADLASRGAALPSVYASACWTIPSHAALFTGLLPRAAGLIRAPGGAPHGCKPAMEAQRERLLPEVLRSAGYATGAVSTNLWLTRASGFATGFDQFVTVDTRRQARLHEAGLRERLRWGVESMRARVDDGAAEAEGVLRRWLEQAPRRPFFWFVNLVECHSPYLPPRPWNDLGPIDRWQAAMEARRHLTLDAIWRSCAGGFDVPVEALERMRHLYRGAVRRVDDWMARVLGHLDSAGILDETLVIVISDHGENFGDDGLMGHAFSLDDRLLHVPCVLAGPGAFAPRGAASLADLPRLIAEALKLESHPWGNGLPPAGTAVAQFDPPTGRDDPRVAEALERWGLGPEAAARITTPMECATDGRLKLLRRGGVEELYELEADPLERTPLPPERGDPERVATLRAALDHPANRTRPSGSPETTAGKPSEEEMRELEDRMRLLGYL